MKEPNSNFKENLSPIIWLIMIYTVAFGIHRIFVQDRRPITYVLTFACCSLTVIICVVAYVFFSVREKKNERSPKSEDKIRPVNITEIEPALRQFADDGNKDAAAIVDMLDEIRSRPQSEGGSGSSDQTKSDK